MFRKNINTPIGTYNLAIQNGEPLIVFLNSFGDFDTAQSFQLLINELPENLGILASDYLNTGFSSTSLKDYTVQDEANELSQIINSLHAQKTIIIAHSIGGVY
ncbi:alpha/beta fold hydrolase [Xylocopilactobacillus apis]|uniref:Alpha/beta hydrolase n=1 Tax=Xylocopilactobacillus apis TaxID=2932183 RepID=A0AAU9D929_9LACO|nr:alpha/beta hydrolase [Xylocopilactobacillus apis]BDR57302.1 hypothetical protein KIMC2_18640 [Xylocopilactobacillus apis]